MSRSAIYNALAADVQLNAMGLTPETIKQGRGIDTRPSDTGLFALIRWEAEPAPVFGTVRPPRRLAVWVHLPAAVSNDFTRIDDALDRIETVLVAMEHVAGVDDSNIVTCVAAKGRSDDLKDEGLQTFCRWQAFEALSRKAVA